MSTIQSSAEHLTLNADGTSKDIKFQANGVEKASISSAGAFTSTTIDATKLTGNLPAISGANLTNLPAQTDSTKLPLAGGTMTGNLSFSNADPAISNSSGNLKISSEDSLVLEMDNNSSNTGGEKIYFRTDPSTTAMTIGEDGDVEIGACIQQYARLNLRNKSGTTSCMTGAIQTNGGAFADFYNAGNGHVGAIRINNSATAYETSSDYRLKENVDYDWDATTRLKQLKPARFNFIADDTNTLVDGFLAHEVSDIVPEAISGTKDAVDEDDNPKYQGIDQSKLVPLLVKTIQELEARIAALEA